MKNELLQICEKLRGYSIDEEYFEVVNASKNENGVWELKVRAVNENKNEGAENEDCTFARKS
jgi:hypothetical protein